MALSEPGSNVSNLKPDGRRDFGRASITAQEETAKHNYAAAYKEMCEAKREIPQGINGILELLTDLDARLTALTGRLGPAMWLGPEASRAVPEKDISAPVRCALGGSIDEIKTLLRKQINTVDELLARLQL